MAHLVDGKAVHQRPAYYELVKFAVEKEAEINFDKAKKARGSTPKPKDTTQFRFHNEKPMLPTTPAVRIVAPAPEEGPGEGDATPIPSEESDSGKSYEATPEDIPSGLLDEVRLNTETQKMPSHSLKFMMLSTP